MNEDVMFREVLAMPLAERAAFLDQACSASLELRVAVERRLAEHEQSQGSPDRTLQSSRPKWVATEN